MTQNPLVVALVAAAVAGLGAFFLLPQRLGTTRPRIWHLIGGLLVVIGVGATALLWTRPEPFLTNAFFTGFALLAIFSAFIMVTGSNPVYSALWFAMVVLATSALFLLAGAQFLAAGTVIVYAGAIIVTFLFVIMLAQSEGQALYDRQARAPLQSTLTAFALLAGLLYAITLVKNPLDHRLGGAMVWGSEQRLAPAAQLLARAQGAGPKGPGIVMARGIGRTQQLPPDDGRAATYGDPPAHMASLGGALFTDHLYSVEIAGAILFVALVGAVAIATPKPPIRPVPARPEFVGAASDAGSATAV